MSPERVSHSPSRKLRGDHDVARKVDEARRTPAEDLFQNLQGTAGNRAVAGLVDQPLSLQRLTAPGTFAQQTKLFARKGKSEAEIGQFKARLEQYGGMSGADPDVKREFLEKFRSDLSRWLRGKGSDSSRRQPIERLIDDIGSELLTLPSMYADSGRSAYAQYGASPYAAYGALSSNENAVVGGGKAPQTAGTPPAKDVAFGPGEDRSLLPADGPGWATYVKSSEDLPSLKRRWVQFETVRMSLSEEDFLAGESATAEKSIELGDLRLAGCRYGHCHDRASEQQKKLGYAGLSAYNYLQAGYLDDAEALMRKAAGLVNSIHDAGDQGSKPHPAARQVDPSSSLSLQPGYEGEEEYSNTWQQKLDGLLGMVDRGEVTDPRIVSLNMEAAGIWPILQGTAAPKVQYLNADEREKYRLDGDSSGFRHASTGLAYDTSEESTAFSGTGYAIFVVSGDDQLYAGSHKVSQFHHSSFMAGGDVKAAGELKIEPGGEEGGKLSQVTNKSGHYHPTTAHLARTLILLSRWGVTLSDVQVKDMNDEKKDKRGESILHPDGLAWLQKYLKKPRS